MFDKNNNQIQHIGNGNHYINQSKNYNYFINYNDKHSNNNSTNSSNESLFSIILTIITVITSSLMSDALDFAKNYIIFLIGFQIILLVPVNLFVYFKSKNIKSLSAELIPSILTPISTIHAITRTPEQVQQFLNQIKAPLDKNFIDTVIQNFFNAINQQNNPIITIALTFFYIILTIFLILSPLIISYNAYFKKTVKNKPSIFVTIFYWIFVFVNTFLNTLL